MRNKLDVKWKIGRSEEIIESDEIVRTNDLDDWTK